MTREEKGVIDSLDALYRAYSSGGAEKSSAVLTLRLTDWFLRLCEFDDATGYPVPSSLVELLQRISEEERADDSAPLRDRLTRIFDHSEKALEHIFRHLREKILRTHEMMPIYAAREVDAKTVQWLSMRPGRTVREKLKGKPHIKAVKRRPSTDTLENRLLKVFVSRLLENLDARRVALGGETPDMAKLAQVARRWLREEAEDIRPWKNLPPNNTLLEDKHYGKIWDAWMWMQNLDRNIQMDQRMLSQVILTAIYWRVLAYLNTSPNVRLMQQPCPFGNIKLKIKPVLKVTGHLFTRVGVIERIIDKKGFGFIREKSHRWFFHATELARSVEFSSLTPGMAVAFQLGHNEGGECAVNVALRPSPVPLNLQYLPDRLHFSSGDKEIEVWLKGGEILCRKNGKVEKHKLLFEGIGELATQISSWLIDESVSPPSSRTEESGQHAFIDLANVRPEFAIDSGHKKLLPFRLIRQYWPHEEYGELETDCGDAKAIGAFENIKTVSMLDAFSNQTENKAVVAKATKAFMTSIGDHIDTEAFTYLVPDALNDFALENVRKAANFHLQVPSPLPKSIAAIFAWQSSRKFEKDGVSKNDFVLVIDSFEDGISITPIQAKFDEELVRLLPESRGIFWERHPTMTVKNEGLLNRVIENLSQDGCPSAEEFARLFGFDGLVSESGNLSVVEAGNWYHVPDDMRDILSQGVEKHAPPSEVFNQCLDSTGKYSRGTRVFFLPLEDNIKKPERAGEWMWLGSAWSLVKGCQTLAEWQDKAEDIALWRDHLPELSVRIVHEGHFENFYLVKDTTVTPQIGRTVPLPLEESFVLPAGQTHYNFPLQQGEGNKELQFVAYLKSPAFPLKKATACKLKMTYTYGADDPYELKFIPLDTAEAGFKSIRVEWRSASEAEVADLENLPVPDFPARKSWSDFQKFPKEDGKSFSDLLDWVEIELAKVCDISRYGRLSGHIPKWIDKGDDNVFCFIDDVFIHKSSLRLRGDQELPKQGETLSFYKVKDDKGKYSAVDVTMGENEPRHCFLSKSLRFPTLTIWNHDHSLSESDVPDHFRNSIFEGTQKIISIIESENMPDTLKQELFFFLCCLHKDAPEIVGSQLLDAVKDKKLLRRYYKNIAFAIGNAELPYQQELLENVIDPIDNEGLTRSITMEVLSIALWRSKTLINKLTKEDIGALSRNLYGCLEFDFQKVVNDGKGYQIATLCKHLELLLALLRSRRNEGEGCKVILSPNADLTQKYVILVDDISKIVINRNIKLKSRISLQIEKPEMFRNTPDLLYALRMYLTGDSGAHAVVITGVSDED
jgi:cold shock CspA family protein